MDRVFFLIEPLALSLSFSLSLSLSLSSWRRGAPKIPPECQRRQTTLSCLPSRDAVAPAQEAQEGQGADDHRRPAAEAGARASGASPQETLLHLPARPKSAPTISERCPIYLSVVVIRVQTWGSMTKACTV